MHLEYAVIALLVIGVILFAVAIAILFPHLQREARADAAEIQALRLKATEPEHDSH
jgi:hypothetical protein